MAEAKSVGEQVRGATRELEAEASRLIAYLNDEVVPQVRHSSSAGLRAAATHLDRLAKYLDRGSRQRPQSQRESARP